jgi:hypothetical protein
MRIATLLILSTALAATYTARADDITSRMPRIVNGQMVNGPPAQPPQPGLGERIINGVTVNGPGGSTVRPNVTTPSNIEDHRTTTPIVGVQVTR